MKPVYFIAYCSKGASIGLLLSVMVAALPARSATFGLVPVGLEPVDDYGQVYASSALPDTTRNPIDEYQTSVTEATNDSTLGVDTPFEQALADAGYNPTIIQGIITKVLARTAGLATAVSDNASLSAFRFDGIQLTQLISEAEASSLSMTNGSKACKRIREKLAKKPGSVSIREQSKCWAR